MDACGDLIGIYGEKADIVKELKLIVDGIYNGQSVEEMLSNFAARSHLDDIESFATIFEVTNRYGGDMRRVVGETREIINDKIEMELEIQTLLTANKNDLNIMIIMPVLIMLMLNGMGNMSIVRNTPFKCMCEDRSTCSFRSCLLHGKKDRRYQDIGGKSRGLFSADFNSAGNAIYLDLGISGSYRWKKISKIYRQCFCEGISNE